MRREIHHSRRRGLAAPALAIGMLAIAWSAPAVLASARDGFEASINLPDGTTAPVTFRRFEITTANTRVIVGTRNADREIPTPPIVLFEGQVRGEPDSWVFLAAGPQGVGGLIRTRAGPLSITRDERSMILSAAPIIAARRMNDPPAPGSPPFCGTDHSIIGIALQHALESTRARGPLPAPSRGDLPCREVDIAVDSDWEFTNNLFAGNTDAAAAYALTLLGAASSIYRRDLNVTLRVVYLRLWEEEADPYRVCGAFDLLYAFRDHWDANMTGVERDLAHLLSARVFPEAAGVASLGGLCAHTSDEDSPFPYGISTRLNGFFPMPPTDHHLQNLDLYLVAHEIGHGFGATHTNLLEPPQDTCPGSCENAAEGTIMSICYLCSGGFENIAMGFHPRSIAENIAPYLDMVACDLSPDEPDCGAASFAAPVTESPSRGAPSAILEPEDLARSRTRTPTLRWSPVEGATAYAVRLGDDAGLAMPIVDAMTDQTSLAVGPGLLENRFTYFWSVVAHTPKGDVAADPPVTSFVVAVAQCSGDADLSGLVDFEDVLLILSRWGFCGPPADANRDGRVDMTDLLTVLFNFSSVCN